MSANPTFNFLGLSAGTPPTPPPGVVYIFVKPSDGTLAQIDSSGTISSLGGGGGDCVETVTAAVNKGITVDNTDPANPILEGIPATESVPGTISAANMVKLNGLYRLKVGDALPDNTVTINPATDKATQYILAGPLTANRVLTLGNGGSPFTGLNIEILTLDTSAFTYEVRSAAAASLLTFAASPGAGVIRSAKFYFNGTNWAFFTEFNYRQTT